MNKYILIDTNNINEARKVIDKCANSGEKAVVVLKNEEFNRKIIENKKVYAILFRDFSSLGENKRLKQRDSGLNQVMCSLANENNIRVALDLDFFVKNKNFLDYLTRFLQNVKLINKYKCKFILVNVRSYDMVDLMGLLSSFGFNTELAKYAIDDSFNLP